MTVRVGINGFGRISRNHFRALVTSGVDFEVAVVNDLTDNKTLAHLLKHNPILGRFPEEVFYDDGAIKVGDKEIRAFAERGPVDLPWNELGVDIVIESTDFSTDATKTKAHLDAGVKKVLTSAPTKNGDITIAMGVNDDEYDPVAHNIISSASCTTNCLTPMVKAFNDGLSITKGLMTTIHAHTQDQNLQDSSYKDLCRARTAALSVMPTTTSAAKAVALVLSELKSKFDDYALRVPTLTGSATDLIFGAPRETSVEEINETVKKVTDGRVLVYTDESLVSKGIETDSVSCIFDSQLIKVIGNQVKVVGRHDNEWDYSNRLVDPMALVGSKL